MSKGTILIECPCCGALVGPESLASRKVQSGKAHYGRQDSADRGREDTAERRQDRARFRPRQYPV